MKFCPECKSMMRPVDGKLRCKRCGYELEVEDATDMQKTVAMTDKEITIVDEEDDIPTMPTTNVRCPECGHDVAEWWLRQLRSADESETRFFRCVKCKFTWREYD